MSIIMKKSRKVDEKPVEHPFNKIDDYVLD